MPDLSIEAQIACARRELAMRERVYPKFVANGKMKQPEADLQIMLMREIVETLRAAKAAV